MYDGKGMVCEGDGMVCQSDVLGVKVLVGL